MMPSRRFLSSYTLRKKIIYALIKTILEKNHVLVIFDIKLSTKHFALRIYSWIIAAPGEVGDFAVTMTYY